MNTGPPPPGFTGEGRFPRPPGGTGHTHPEYGNTPRSRQVWSCHYDESVVEGEHWTWQRERTNRGDSWAQHSTAHHLEALILHRGPQYCEHGENDKEQGRVGGGGEVGHNRGWDLPHQENLQNPSHTPAPSFHLITTMTAWDPKSNRDVSWPQHKHVARTTFILEMWPISPPPVGYITQMDNTHTPLFYGILSESYGNSTRQTVLMDVNSYLL